MQLDRSRTAVVFIDPQNEVMSEKGAVWAAVGASVTENKTVENMERIFRATKQHGYEVVISPRFFYPTDSGRKFTDSLESSEFAEKIFARRGAFTLDGFAGGPTASSASLARFPGAGPRDRRREGCHGWSEAS